MFSIGEYVSLLKEEGKFKILTLLKDSAIIEDEYGFEREIQLKSNRYVDFYFIYWGEKQIFFL